MVTVAVLGPVRVRRDGRDVAVHAGKTAQLLVRLAVEVGVVVGADRLVEDLWADDAVVTTRNTLQAKVSRLRRALGDAALVVGTRGGYALDLPAEAVDAGEALRMAGVGSARRGAGDAAGTLEAASAGLALFRGDVLPGAGDGDWVMPYRVRLEEAHARLTEDELAARMELDGPAAVVGELEHLVRRHPLREGLWSLLVTALYRSGRPSDAVAAYQRIRRLLADDLGLDPGRELQQLFARVLTQDESLPVRAVPPQDRRTGNLPSMTAELVDRELETAQLHELLRRSRAVQVTGPGGVGKTATALAVAVALSRSQDGPADGVWLARLEAAATADDVVDALVAALRLPGGEAALLDRLAGAEALVVLDNCEQVLDGAAALAVRLLDAAPRLRVLCTSQVPLDVDGSLVLELAPLPLASAVRLFRRRAAARLSSGDRDDAALLQLCRCLDGLPLAIELAAARTRSMGVEEIHRRLDDRFSVLSDPTSRRPDRRRSLRSTIGWSYDLLLPEDQRGLWALGAFAGGASLPAVERVLAALDVPPSAAADVLGRLAVRSMLLVDHEPSRGDAPPSVRYRLLDSIGAFARAAADDAGTSERAAAAHAEWVTGQADVSTAGVRGARQAEHLALAHAERSNVDAALTWCADHDPPRALRIARGFGWAWVVLGDSRGADRLRAALRDAGRAAPAAARADALLLAAWIEASTGDLRPAREHIATAAALAEQADDPLLAARCQYYLSYVVSHSGEFAEGLQLAERGLQLLDATDQPWDRAAAGLFATRAATSAGDRARSAAALEQVGVELRRVDDPWLHARCEAARGELARLEHRFDDAIVHLGLAAQASARHGYAQTEAYHVASLGRAQCQAGAYDAGAATLAVAVGKAEGTGDPRLAALTRVHLARVLRALGDGAGARAAAESAVTWHRAAGGGEQALLGECVLAALDAQDRTPGARTRLASVLESARGTQDAPAAVLALDALGRLAAVERDRAAADRLWAEADAWMPAASHAISPRDRQDALPALRGSW